MKNFLLILVTIIWGSTFFIIKDTVGTANEYFIVFGRMLLAAIPMLLFVSFTNRKSLLNKHAIINGAVLGLLLTISYLAQTVGLKYTSSGHSAFITGGAVIFVPVIMFVLFREKFSKSDFFSILVVVNGLFLLTYDFNTEINKGDIITLITAVATALHIILAGQYVRKTDSLPLITYQFISGSIFSLIGLLITDFEFVNIPPMTLYSITYLGLMGTLFCYFVSVWVQKYDEFCKSCTNFYNGTGICNFF